MHTSLQKSEPFALDVCSSSLGGMWILIQTTPSQACCIHALPEVWLHQKECHFAKLVSSSSKNNEGLGVGVCEATNRFVSVSGVLEILSSPTVVWTVCIAANVHDFRFSWINNIWEQNQGQWFFLLEVWWKSSLCMAKERTAVAVRSPVLFTYITCSCEHGNKLLPCV